MNKDKAYYLSSNDNIAKTKNNRLFAIIASLFMILTIIAAPIASTVMSNNYSTAHAEDDKGHLEKAASNDNTGTDSKGLDIAVKKTTNTDFSGDKNRDTFRFIIDRVMNTRYMNDTRTGETGGDHKNDLDWICSLEDKHKNTPLYHNCDIPNIATDFYQKVTQVLFPMGFSEAGIETAKVPFGFGVPSQIPGGEVPLTYKNESIKYSALETFGYSMHYSGYNGEWDHIQVYNSIRALSNFGLMDDIKLGIKTAVGSYIAGAGAAASTALDSLSKGDPIGAVTKGWSAFWSGAASHAVNKIIDTSDLNVNNNYGWYRVDYGSTLYNARELTQEELGAAMVQATKNQFGQKKAEAAHAGDDLNKYKDGPPAPRPKINECIINGKPFQGKQGSKNYGGVSKAECDAEAKSSSSEDTEKFTQRPQNISEWKSEQAGPLALNTQYSLGCKVPTKDSEMQAFTDCWKKAVPGAITKAKGDAQAELNNTAVNSIFDDIMGFFKTNPRNNYNAPFNRFVCTNKDGTDMKASGKDEKFAVNSASKSSQVFLYSVKGELNPACSQVRPPIQNGLFGNGYGAGDDNIIKFNNPDKGKSVPFDGRRQLFVGIGFLNIITTGCDTIANELINITSMTTRVSNTALDFSFSPILGHLDLEKHFVEWINAFRDSVYFGLVGLVFGISAVTAFGRAIKNTNPMQGLKDAAIMVGVFFFGVILLYSPKLIFGAVDTIPSMAETTIAGTIFQASSPEGDQTCTTTGSIPASKDEKQSDSLSGSALDFSPRDSVRTMECEVWRSFALNPYIYGQWGTGYANLDTKAFKNTNSALVGNAEVNLGGGRKVNNWGLYQLSLLTSGTSSYDANINGDASQVIPRDLYRIVDAQAGPDNNAGVYNKHFKDWSGTGTAGVKRVLITLYGNIVSVFGMITIVSYSLVKIELTLMSFVMLLLIPIMLLIGIHPTAGRVQLKKYFGTIIGLMVQRIALVALLAIMIKLISGAGQSSDNYFMAGTAILALCLLFFTQRKKLLEMFTSPIDSKFGGSMIDSNASLYSHAKKTMPKSMQNRMDSNRGKTKGMLAGAAAGYSVNGVEGIGKSLDRARDAEERRSMRRSTRRGLGLNYQIEKSKDAGIKAAKKQHAGSDLQTELNHNVNDKIADNLIDERVETLKAEEEAEKNSENVETPVAEPEVTESANSTEETENDNEDTQNSDDGEKSEVNQDIITNSEVRSVDDLKSNQNKNSHVDVKTDKDNIDEVSEGTLDNDNTSTTPPLSSVRPRSKSGKTKDDYKEEMLRQKAKTQLKKEGVLKDDVQGALSDDLKLQVNLDDRKTLRIVSKIEGLENDIAALTRKRNATERAKHEDGLYSNNRSKTKDSNGEVIVEVNTDDITTKDMLREQDSHQKALSKYDKELASLRRDREKAVQELVDRTQHLKDIDEDANDPNKRFEGVSDREIRKESLKDMRRELGEAFRIVLPIYGDDDINKGKISAPFNPEDDGR